MVSYVDGELCVFLDGHGCKQRSVSIERKMDSQVSRRKMDEWKDIQVCGWAGGWMCKETYEYISVCV